MPAFRQADKGLGDVVARRVLQGDQTQQAQVAFGLLRARAACGRAPGAAAMASTLSPRAARECALSQGGVTGAAQREYGCRGPP